MATTRRRKSRRKPLSAQEFFGQRIAGAGVNDAHFASKISLTTLNGLVRGKRTVTVETANALQEWSESLRCPTYISAMKTLGVRSEL